MNYIFPLIWLLGVAISIDEMAVRYNGHHNDMKCIIYKAEGYGFQVDALFQGGFTYHIFMRNDPSPPKYMDQCLSPLRARVVDLFDILQGTYHRCTMANLYRYSSFCCCSYNHEKKVLCRGVTRKFVCGIPCSVI